MLLTIFGLILIAIPFLLVFSFKNKINGFVVVLGSVLALHLVVAFVTQFFHIFFYPVLIIIYLIIALGVLAVIKFKFKNTSFKIKINWLVIVGFLIIFLELWSVHFAYTGTVNTVLGPRSVFNEAYPYPYFSDEWVGVALANYSINNNNLPIINPLELNSKSNSFTNVFVCFFSVISEVFLVLNLLPLYGYVFLSIFVGLVICLLIFLFLRANKVDSFVSLFITLCVPYLVNGVNLPGVWYLIPFTAGFMAFLISLISASLNNRLFYWLMSILTILLYPPLIVFVFPTFLISLLLDTELKKKAKLKILLAGFLTVGLLALLIIYSQRINAKILFDFAISSVWHLNLDNGIPTFYIWCIVPVFLLPLAVFGLVKIFNKKYLAFTSSLIIGICLWLIYTFSQNYFFIDYARVVILTSFLVIILSGIGLNWLLEKIIKKYNLSFNKKFILLIKSVILILFGLSSFVYTNRLNWQDLKLKVYGTYDSYVTPAPPANLYLNKDDIRLFEGISKTRFLSVPWKGLVIGVATGNYPVSSKQSIVGQNLLDYNDFMNKTCEDKAVISKKMSLGYVYSTEFKCDKFVEVGRSEEGFILYKFIK